MKIRFVLIVLFLSQISFSQLKSVLKGTVIEEASGRTMPAVNVVVKGTKFATTTDAEGNFIIRNIEIGKYDVQFSAMGFDSKLISDVDVIANDAILLNVSLAEKKNVLDEVVVTRVRAKAESIKSLLAAQKNSVRVSDGISAETIKRTPDRTTSDVLKRISGASIQDNKFVIVRGLNDRYNTSFLNGSPLPSSEPDRKAFSFDIFPANMIDNLVIYKTASPDLPGEFAGGVIEITTKSVPEKDFQSVSVGTGYNTVSTGKKQVYSEGGKTDWLGIDGGTRAFPSSFPSTQQFQALQAAGTPAANAQIVTISKEYNSDWSLKEKMFNPNSSFNFTLGRTKKLNGDSNFSYLASVTQSISNNFNEIDRNGYDQPNLILSEQKEQNYSTQTLLGAIANFTVKINANNTFSFKNLYSINSDNRIIEREGSVNQELEPEQTRTNARLFTSNKIYTTQVSGDHFLSASKIKINWVGSYASVNRLTPNDRRNRYIYFKLADGTTTQPEAVFSSNIDNTNSGFFYSSKNAENIFSTKIDASRKFKLSDSFSFDIKTGVFRQTRDRIFTARQVVYAQLLGQVNGVNYGLGTFEPSIRFQNDANIFSQQNIGVLSTPPGKSGLVLFDGTRQNDSYDASSELNAGYLMLDNSYGKFRLIWGMRIENYIQNLFTIDTGKMVNVFNQQVDYLPSANLIVGLNKTQNLRFSFSKTLNRPEFRELAPFLFFDAATEQNTEGTTDLKIASVLNYDFRYEIFPGKGQLFSISAFYKKFDNPIELIALANNANKYLNTASAEAKGIELEFRSLLSTFVGKKSPKLFEDITLYSNLAIIKSKVDTRNAVNLIQTNSAPLQGQSPYVLNAGIQYLNADFGWGTALNLNRVGSRIFIQGNATDDAFQTAIWEKSRTFLDLQISKSLMKKKIELKLNIQNILAQNQIFYRNTTKVATEITGFEGFVNNVFNGDAQNLNGYNADVDNILWNIRFGTTFSFNATYNF